MKVAIFFTYITEMAAELGISLDEALTLAKTWGYTAFDFDKEEFTLFEGSLEQIRRHGFSVCSVYGEYDFLNGTHSDACDIIDCAVECGSPNVMVLPGNFSVGEITDEMKKNPALMRKFLDGSEKAQRALSAFRKTLAYAKEKGINVTVEDYGAAESLTSYVSQIEWLFDNLDGLKFTYDTGNFYLNDEDAVLALDKFLSKSVHVHCKDYYSNPAPRDPEFTYDKVSVAVGHGDFPMTEIINKIRSYGYDGYYNVEYLGNKDKCAAVIKASAEYLLSFGK